MEKQETDAAGKHLSPVVLYIISINEYNEMRINIIILSARTSARREKTIRPWADWRPPRSRIRGG